jgi:hypothetical protein
MVERKRVEKYDRDLKRWEYMDDEENRNKSKIESMNEKCLTG